MEKILIPIDGSSAADNAVKYVIAAAKRGVKADLHLLHVQPPLRLGEVDDIAKPGLIERLGYDQADHAVAGATRLLEEAGIKYSTRTVTGDPAQEIALYADVHACDQIVMGTRGLGVIKGLLLGSVATKVLHLVKVPVTFVK